MPYPRLRNTPRGHCNCSTASARRSGLGSWTNQHFIRRQETAKPRFPLSQKYWVVLNPRRTTTYSPNPTRNHLLYIAPRKFLSRNLPLNYSLARRSRRKIRHYPNTRDCPGLLACKVRYPLPWFRIRQEMSAQLRSSRAIPCFKVPSAKPPPIGSSREPPQAKRSQRRLSSHSTARPHPSNKVVGNDSL